MQQRIQQDAELREMWHDPAIRQHAVMAPERAQGITVVPEMRAEMTKLMELVRALTEDPAVHSRIQADPELREIWSEPGVRQRIQPTGQP